MQWTSLIVFCGYLSYTYGQGAFDNMANDPSLLMEPNPSGGMLPPEPPSKPKRKKGGLLDAIDIPRDVPTTVEPYMEAPVLDATGGVPDQPLGFIDHSMMMPEQPVVGSGGQDMGAMNPPQADQSMLPPSGEQGGPRVDKQPPVNLPMGPPPGQDMGLLDQVETHGGAGEKVNQEPPVDVQKTNKVPFTLGGGEVVKEWMSTNFADKMRSFDASPKGNQLTNTPSKSVSKIFSSNLGSVQVAGDGMGRNIPMNGPPRGQDPPRRPMVESQFSAPGAMDMDPMDMGPDMANAGVFDQFDNNGIGSSSSFDVGSTLSKGRQMLAMASGIAGSAPRPGTAQQKYQFAQDKKEEKYACTSREHLTATGVVDESAYEEFNFGRWVPRMCAPGSGYNVTTCACTNNLNVEYRTMRFRSGACTPDMALSFNGDVRDTSGNGASVEHAGVDLVDGTAYFDGTNRLYVWRYQGYDYRDKLQISFQFKPQPGHRAEPYTLVSNCEGEEEPSYGIVLNSFSNITTIFLKTYDVDNQRFMTFEIDPTRWNDVYFRYENGTMIGRVNNVIKTKSVTGIIQHRPDAMVFANCKRYGNFKGQLKDIVVYSKCLPPYDGNVEMYLRGMGN